MARYIDADLLIGDLHNHAFLEGDDRSICYNIIQKQPAADVRENVRGECKIKKASIHPYGNDVCCSICGHTMGSSFGYKFCPMCGADMRQDHAD